MHVSCSPGSIRRFEANWALRVDTLTAVMLVVVTRSRRSCISIRSATCTTTRTAALLRLSVAVHLRHADAGDGGQPGADVLRLGRRRLASYLLIGFWYKKPSANAAAIKAFVVNRVGDFGFALGIFAVFLVFGTVAVRPIFAAAPASRRQDDSISWHTRLRLTMCCLLLFIGAMGKSAQFLLHTWLPDAMEGPTPVSALIHAATMVTAGVFMVARLSPMFELLRRPRCRS
jgi:NADH-quinone oxidoreductase subunit L